VLVARYHKTSEKEIENSIKRLLQAGVQVRGTILNDIMKSAALYYSSGYSQQGYGYTQRNKREVSFLPEDIRGTMRIRAGGG
jgi:tyrosine-protein kinase Etk/Wzc